eukprot:1303764-Rhodomonas_salina.5
MESKLEESERRVEEAEAREKEKRLKEASERERSDVFAGGGRHRTLRTVADKDQIERLEREVGTEQERVRVAEQSSTALANKCSRLQLQLQQFEQERDREEKRMERNETNIAINGSIAAVKGSVVAINDTAALKNGGRDTPLGADIRERVEAAQAEEEVCYVQRTPCPY